MWRKIVPVLSAVLLSLLAAVPAFALSGKPDFGPHIYVDGVAWGTKATTPLPHPAGAARSFDKLYVFKNGADGQLLVAEAAPGDRDYNGGRWQVYTVEWTSGTPSVLTSDADILAAEAAGMLTVTPGSFEGGPPAYFSCPLLPVKD